MSYTLGTAAKATGLSRTAILRAINSGKISAKKNEHGEWDIDPAELHRVYPPKPSLPVTDNTQVNDTHRGGNTSDNREIQAKLDALEQRLRDKDEVISDLRTRLDQSEEERRNKDRQLTALLTDQREKAAQPDPYKEAMEQMAKRLEDIQRQFDERSAKPEPQPEPARPRKWWQRLTG